MTTCQRMRCRTSFESIQSPKLRLTITYRTLRRREEAGLAVPRPLAGIVGRGQIESARPHWARYRQRVGDSEFERSVPCLSGVPFATDYPAHLGTPLPLAFPKYQHGHILTVIPEAWMTATREYHLATAPLLSLRLESSLTTSQASGSPSLSCSNLQHHEKTSPSYLLCHA